ncbi:helix-turn-helix domain-containing protein [Acidisoma sp. C75]
MPKLSAPVKPIDLSQPPALATIAETCATLRISRATCCRWIEAGRLESVKLGHAVRIKVPSIAAIAA